MQLESTESPERAISRRVANLMRQSRERSGESTRAFSRRSVGRFNVRELRMYERGDTTLPDGVARELARLYDFDLESALYERPVLAIDPAGVLETSGVSVPFAAGDTVSLLTAYLLLVRKLRSQEKPPTIDLRSDDIEELVRFTGKPGAVVVDQLGALMGATRAQRSAMVGLFASGAAVIAFAVAASLAASPHAPSSGNAGSFAPAEAPSMSTVVDGSVVVIDDPIVVPTDAATEPTVVVDDTDTDTGDPAVTTSAAQPATTQTPAGSATVGGSPSSGGFSTATSTTVIDDSAPAPAIQAPVTVAADSPPLPPVGGPEPTPVVASQAPAADPIDTSGADAAIAGVEEAAAQAAAAAAVVAAQAVADAASAGA